MNILKLSSHEISQIFIYFSEPVLFVLICNGTWRIVIFVKSNDDVTVIDSCWFWFCFVRSRKELHITRMKTICLLEICGENKMRRDAYSNTFECNIFEIVLLLSFKYITFKEKYFSFYYPKIWNKILPHLIKNLFLHKNNTVISNWTRLLLL